MSLENFVKKKNNKKILFTPGPAALLADNIKGLEPCFGRGDKIYLNLENNVLDKLKKMTKHKNITRMQGSASLALEIMILNFISGNVLIINSGYYSDRLFEIAKQAKRKYGFIKNISYIKWKDIGSIKKKFTWLLSCVTETSTGFLIPIKDLNKIKKKVKANLALDATASIGLENDHNFADVLAYSSCKGLFGLTGGSFIAFNKFPKNKIDSFYLNHESHFLKKMTGPYHAICSLFYVLKNYKNYKRAVLKNKNKFLKLYKKSIIYKKRNQPMLCTLTNNRIVPKNNKNNVILYQPRSNIRGSIVCHLGEVHLKKNANGKIFNYIDEQKC